MKLLLIGGNGLLGKAVAEDAFRRGYEVLGASRSSAPLRLDIADDDRLVSLLDEVRPDLVVNCAALTDIAACEQDPCLAYRINARPLATLAEWSKHQNRPLVHVSTDHFFTGGGAKPHAEDEPVSFANEYARSKFAGEAFALTSPHALVLRVSVIGIRARGAPTLAEWAIATIEAGEPITTFEDAHTSSLDAGSCARAAMDLAARRASGRLNLGTREVYTKGALLREFARQLGRNLNHARAGSVAELTPARASSLGLDVSLAERRLAYDLPDLETVVAAVIRQYRDAARQ